MAVNLTLANVRLLNVRSGSLSRPTDIGVSHGRITTPQPEWHRIDADGRIAMPGLWDSHVHFASWARSRVVASVHDSTSAQDCARKVAGLAAEGAGVYVAEGYCDSTWPDAPSLELLDSAVPHRPCVLLSFDRHSCWLNTPAFEWFGLEPNPTGRLVEEESFFVEYAVAHGSERIDDLIRQAGRQAAAVGIVGVVDVEKDPTPVPTWRRRMEAGFDSLRVRAVHSVATLDQAIVAGWRTGDRITDLLEIGPLKVIADGSMSSRTAATTFAYPGEADHPYGIMNVDADELARLLATATNAGLECAVHAIGDAGAHVVLDAFEAAGAHGSIEHAQLLQPSDIDRMARLSLRASVQPNHLLGDRDAAETLWAGHTAHAFPLRSLLDAGVPLALGSDAPVTPLDPWGNIQTAVTRTTLGREPWHPEQCIQVAEALASSTRGVTSLEINRPADVVILDDNPFTRDEQDLHSMPVWLTLCAGRVTFGDGRDD